MLALAASLDVAVALLLAYVAWRLRIRVVATPESRASFAFFRLWWWAAAAAMLVSPVRVGLHLAGRLPGWLYLATEHASVLLLSLGLWGLVCNLAYLYTGRVRLWPWLAAGYGLLALVLVGNLDRLGPPEAIVANDWTLQAASQGAASPVWVAALAVAGLILVPAASAAGYLALLRHAPDATARYRIALVGVSILLWFGSSLAATVFGWQGLAGFVVSRGLAATSAILALAAYDPPAWVRDRGIRRAGEEADAGTARIFGPARAHP